MGPQEKAAIWGRYKRQRFWRNRHHIPIGKGSDVVPLEKAAVGPRWKRRRFGPIGKGGDLAPLEKAAIWGRKKRRRFGAARKGGDSGGIAPPCREAYSGVQTSNPPPFATSIVEVAKGGDSSRIATIWEAFSFVKNFGLARLRLGRSSSEFAAISPVREKAAIPAESPPFRSWKVDVAKGGGFDVWRPE